MNRREFLETTGAALAGYMLASSFAGAADATPRPNILLILAEDISIDLACYGTPAVHTPHLDSLAAQGVRYLRAFTTSPVCSPSRSAMMTGMYQTSIGAHHHRTPDRKGLPIPVKTIPEYLRSVGYYTALGCGFSAKLDLNFRNANLFDGADWKDRKPGQPFFAQITLADSHRFVFTRDPQHRVDPAKVFVPPYLPDVPLVRQDIANYLESIQVVDRAVGNILQRLDQEGLAESTVVFFIGDNGRGQVRGKEYLYEPGIRVPLLVRWPGKIKPGSVREELVSAIDLSAETLRLAGWSLPAHLQGRPFLDPGASPREYIVAALDRSGSTFDRVRCVRTRQYKYIRNYYPQLPWVTMANLYQREVYPVQTLLQVYYAEGKLNPDQARFMAPTRPAEELYDLDNDPFELHNLADTPESQQDLAHLRAILEAWVEETKDVGATPEDPAIAARLYTQYYQAFEKSMRKRGLDPECSPADYLKWWERTLLESE